MDVIRKRSLSLAPKKVAAAESPGKWAFSIPELAAAREIRIAGVGHPVEWGARRASRPTWLRSQFRSALERREYPFGDALSAEYRLLDYALRQLRDDFQKERTGLERELAEMLADDLQRRAENVASIAQQIDKDYQEGDGVIENIGL